MPTHAGQLAFAGGHKSQEEVNPVETALRELNEETSIESQSVKVIGVLDSVRTSGNKSIIPVVLYIDKDPIEIISKLESNGEWDDAILVPYKYLESKSNWSHGISMRESSVVKIRFCSIPASKTVSTNNSAESTLLWGATAQMIWNFFKICP